MLMPSTPLLLLSIKLKLLTAVNGLDIQGLCVPLCVCLYVCASMYAWFGWWCLFLFKQYSICIVLLCFC